MEDQQGRILLRIARHAIQRRFGDKEKFEPIEPWLKKEAASFVTLTRQGELRGCMGSIEPRRPLCEDVRQNALAAAFGDPRFSPLSREELDDTRIEVSVLSPIEPLSFSDEADVLNQLRPGIDGIVFEHGGCRSTFLPQVWESLPDPGEFLGHLKRKAGFSADFWAPDVRLWRYTCRKWKEDRE